MDNATPRPKGGEFTPDGLYDSGGDSVTPETGILHCQVLQLQHGVENALYGSSVRNCDLRISNPDTPHPQAVDNVRDGKRLPAAVFEFRAHATRLPTASHTHGGLRIHSRQGYGARDGHKTCIAGSWIRYGHCIFVPAETYEHPHENNILQWNWPAPTPALLQPMLHTVANRLSCGRAAHSTDCHGPELPWWLPDPFVTNGVDGLRA